MTTISPEAILQITWGLLGAVCIASLTIGWRAAVVLSRIDRRLASLEESRYTLPAAAEHALRFALENPGLSVPDPRDPSKLIVSPLTLKKKGPSE